ncbi:hypothetical protein H634G_03975 [Metarhizium anisopliae BRIP 53293]|uniref:NADH:ubiquinone oxidoreductase 20.1kD subunit n=1 Tax=Metarhizium anisopliae BRIP 53293 TaxID=1291518 RepID=A0A0D9P403_METAN|nr:hypothetical protein H634G_03975 [Metarhizium anisopliae BRIP 53293]KJK95469.1 hypothetical protein H633G_00648 [Metarhizium anisopliae BRIP 53284]
MAIGGCPRQQQATSCDPIPARTVGSESNLQRHHVINEQLGANDAINRLKMPFQRLVRSSAVRSGLAATRCLPVAQRRGFLPASLSDRKVFDAKYPDRQTMSEAEDPGMNGGYINPPRIKRQFRDPYATWWDPQERRNFGEPIHEDNDVLGIFSPYEYTWTKPGPGLIMIGSFVAVFLGLSGLVYLKYPDQPTYPREFEAGLERELGGPGAVRARREGDEDP